jgi:hypothetical protein
MSQQIEPELTTPVKRLPERGWRYYDIWERVNDLTYSLPNYFKTDLNIKGVNITDIFSIGSIFANVIELEVVEILNKLRNIWDPENEYSNYAFIRQSQTFPDVLLKNMGSEDDVIFGIELKSWYVLSKEGEPSFRYKIDPNACAEADLLIIIPWLLSEAISGTPKLLKPYKELARYAAEYRNYYWMNSRRDTTRRNVIARPPGVEPYPRSKEEASDKAEDDGGNNFGRIARSGIFDNYINGIKSSQYLGVKIDHWIGFLKAISETGTDDQIKRKIEDIRNEVQEEISEYKSTEEKVEYQIAFLNIIERLEEIWKKL